jgi:hypothetical protein
VHEDKYRLEVTEQNNMLATLSDTDLVSTEIYKIIPLKTWHKVVQSQFYRINEPEEPDTIKISFFDD